MTTTILCATPRVGSTVLLDCLRGAVATAGEWPDASGIVMVHWTQMPLIFERDTRFVHLTRDDLTAQAVSWAYAAASGRFHSTQAPTGAPVYDVSAIAAAELALTAQHQAWLDWFAGRGRLTLIYETDIAPDPMTAAQRILDYAGIDRAPRPPTLTRVDRDEKAHWLRRYCTR